MNRGFMILAQNSAGNNYLECARVLCRSIKNVMPSEKVALLTDKKVDADCFDYVTIFPYGDQCSGDGWKLANDWQIYDASPFDHTIKLEADMYLPRSIDYWWHILQTKDVVISTTIRNYKNEISKNRFYRRIFDQNKLPDVYNAITYFRKSSFAAEFYAVVKDIFQNWTEYKKVIKCGDQERATTDVVYGLAARILGEELCTMPNFTDMSMVHMKQGIIDTVMSDWSRELIYEISPETFRINTIPQLYPVHYQVKDFALKIKAEL